MVNPASLVSSDNLRVEVEMVVTEPSSFATTREPNVQGVLDARPLPPVILKLPEPKTEEPLIVFMLVPETRTSCLLERAVEVATLCNTPEPM